LVAKGIMAIALGIGGFEHLVTALTMPSVLIFNIVFAIPWVLLYSTLLVFPPASVEVMVSLVPAVWRLDQGSLDQVAFGLGPATSSTTGLAKRSSSSSRRISSIFLTKSFLGIRFHVSVTSRMGRALP